VQLSIQTNDVVLVQLYSGRVNSIDHVVYNVNIIFSLLNTLVSVYELIELFIKLYYSIYIVIFVLT